MEILQMLSEFNNLQDLLAHLLVPTTMQIITVLLLNLPRVSSPVPLPPNRCLPYLVQHQLALLAVLPLLEAGLHSGAGQHLEAELHSAVVQYLLPPLQCLVEVVAAAMVVVYSELTPEFNLCLVLTPP